MRGRGGHVKGTTNGRAIHSRRGAHIVSNNRQGNVIVTCLRPSATRHAVEVWDGMDEKRLFY